LMLAFSASVVENIQRMLLPQASSLQDAIMQQHDQRYHSISLKAFYMPM
jgi:hypothetical protein